MPLPPQIPRRKFPAKKTNQVSQTGGCSPQPSKEAQTPKHNTRSTSQTPISKVNKQSPTQQEPATTPKESSEAQKPEKQKAKEKIAGKRKREQDDKDVMAGRFWGPWPGEDGFQEGGDGDGPHGVFMDLD
jgi:hypothetical protein